MTKASVPTETKTRTPERPARLVSLDAFRGLTILGMLLVNNVALDVATPRQLVHAPWNQGVRFADLVFPWFLLIVGIAIPYSAASHRRKGLPAWRYVWKAVSRGITLVLLGCLIDSSIAKRPILGLGVLQLIGLAYVVAALMYVLGVRWRLAISALFLIGHWAAIRFVPVPGAPSGVFIESQNLITHLNETYLAPLHLKGIISVIPTSALALIGTALGDLLRWEQIGAARKAQWLAGCGALLALAGFLWSLDIPFNKPVWTASYILYAAGLGSLVLAAMFALIDIKGLGAWALVLVVPGMNAIFAYVAPILVKLYILQQWQVTLPDGATASLQTAFLQYCVSHAGRVGGGWLYTISYIAFWWLLLYWMYRKRAFLRV